MAGLRVLPSQRFDIGLRDGRVVGIDVRKFPADVVPERHVDELSLVQAEIGRCALEGVSRDAGRRVPAEAQEERAALGGR